MVTALTFKHFHPHEPYARVKAAGGTSLTDPVSRLWHLYSMSNVLSGTPRNGQPWTTAYRHKGDRGYVPPHPSQMPITLHFYLLFTLQVSRRDRRTQNMHFTIPCLSTLKIQGEYLFGFLLVFRLKNKSEIKQYFCRY